MKYVKLPKTDLTISNICLGTDHYGGRIPEDTAFTILDRFAAMGGNILDTANIYGKWLPAGDNASEKVIGKWIKSRGISDEKMLVATKGGHYDLQNPSVSRVTRKALRHDLEESLLALNRDHVDLYWYHRDRPGVPAGELLEWMEELVKEGKIRFYGASNFTSGRMDEAASYAAEHGLTGFVGLQNRWSLAAPNPAPPSADTMQSMDAAFYDWHVRTGMPLFPYTSSARGFFAKCAEGRVTEDLNRAYGNERNRKLFGLLSQHAKECGSTPYVLGQAFLLSQPFPVIPLMTARIPEHLQDFEAVSECVIPDEWMRQYLACGIA